MNKYKQTASVTSLLAVSDRQIMPLVEGLFVGSKARQTNNT